MALALGVLDVRGPEDLSEDVPYQQHWCLAGYLLDGHHRVQAAAELGVGIDVLLFLSRQASIASEEEIAAAIDAIG